MGLGPNNKNNGNNGIWLAVVVLVVRNRLLFKPGSMGGRVSPRCCGTEKLAKRGEVESALRLA